jgi:hypothetical protein
MREDVAVASNPLVLKYILNKHSKCRIICLVSDNERDWVGDISQASRIIILRIKNSNLLEKIISAIKIIRYTALSTIIISPYIKSKVMTVGFLLARVKKEYSYEGLKNDIVEHSCAKIIISREDMLENLNPIEPDFIINENSRIFIGQPYEELVLNKTNPYSVVAKKYKEIVLGFNPTHYILHPKENTKNWLPEEKQIRLIGTFEQLALSLENINLKLTFGGVESVALNSIRGGDELYAYRLDCFDAEVNAPQINLLNKLRDKGVIVHEVVGSFTK